MRSITRVVMAMLVVLLLGGFNQVGAQVAPLTLSLEGPLENVFVRRGEILVMGIRVAVPPGTPINTPTVDLVALAAGGNPLELLLGAPLPGRTQPGFLGGTAIVTGTVNPDGSGATADNVFVEPAETVLIGTITSATCSNARCAGPNNTLNLLNRRLIPIRDARMAPGPITNEFGFEVDLTGAAITGAFASAEGYFIPRRSFFYHTLEITGAPAANAGTPEVSIQRAQCGLDPDGIQLDVLGGVHDPNTGNVTIVDAANPATVYGSVAAVPDPASIFGTYTFRLRNNAQIQTCPATVMAQFSGATATSPVDTR